MFWLVIFHPCFYILTSWLWFCNETSSFLTSVDPLMRPRCRVASASWWLTYLLCVVSSDEFSCSLIYLKNALYPVSLRLVSSCLHHETGLLFSYLSLQHLEFSLFAQSSLLLQLCVYIHHDLTFSVFLLILVIILNNDILRLQKKGTQPSAPFLSLSGALFWGYPSCSGYLINLL